MTTVDGVPAIPVPRRLSGGTMSGVVTRWVQPWRRGPEAPPAVAGPVVGTTAPTAVLDWRSPAVRSLVTELGDAADGRGLLRRAHGLIATRVRPVYALDDAQPVSRTLARGRGSCSQRLAVLEAVARRVGIPTRSRGLVVDGAFWYPRFPRVRFVVPAEVVLPWPGFSVDGAWLSASELFGTPDGHPPAPFTNAGGETLFEALARGAVDWDGAASRAHSCSSCDLSPTVLRDLGYFDSRDDVLARHGQTLSRPARLLAEPVLSRWSATSRRDR